MTLLVVCLSAGNLLAQDTNEFQRIAKRIMDAYEVGEELEHAPDSTRLYGGAYLGAGSNGRAMPSGYVTYLRDNLLLTSQLSMDFSEVNSTKDVETDFFVGGDRTTSSDVLTKYRKHDFSTRLDYVPSKGHILTVGVLESFDHRRVNESTIRTGHDMLGNEATPAYEEQERSNRDVRLGGLMQYIREFPSGQRLTARLNLKYNYKPTDVKSETWSPSQSTVKEGMRQTLHNFDPYAMVRFQFQPWHGIKCSLQEKYTIEDMSISDSSTEFDFNTYSSLTSLSAAYAHGWFSLDATVSYENYATDITQSWLNTWSHDHTYNDWMLTAKATAQLSEHHKLQLSYDRDIVRPTYTQLYPYEHIGSSIGVMVVGNTQLSPSKHSQVKGSYTYSGRHWTLTHSLAYKRISDDITQTSFYDNVAKRTVKTWVNDARYGYLRYAAEGEMRYGLFSMTMGFHGQYLSYEGENVSSDKAWSYSFKARPQVQLPDGWTLATVLLFTGRETHRYYYNRSNFYLSARAVKQLGDWAIYAIFQDILEPDRIQVLTNDQANTTTTTQPNTRCLIVGCSYTF